LRPRLATGLPLSQRQNALTVLKHSLFANATKPERLRSFKGSETD
jgi:hypothetical protein